MNQIMKKGLLILLCGFTLSLPSYADGGDTILVDKLKPLPPPIDGDNEELSSENHAALYMVPGVTRQTLLFH